MINIILEEKKTSIPIRFNAYYKLVLLLAIINKSGVRNRASLQIIHLIFWALRDEKNYKVLNDLKLNLRNTLIPWSFEFGLEKVLALGYIEEYINKEIVSGQLEIALTVKGLAMLNSIKDAELFEEEMERIQNIGRIPKKRLEKANNNWRLI